MIVCVGKHCDFVADRSLQRNIKKGANTGVSNR